MLGNVRGNKFVVCLGESTLQIDAHNLGETKEKLINNSDLHEKLRFTTRHSQPRCTQEESPSSPKGQQPGAGVSWQGWPRGPLGAQVRERHNGCTDDLPVYLCVPVPAFACAHTFLCMGVRMIRRCMRVCVCVCTHMYTHSCARVCLCVCVA